MDHDKSGKTAAEMWAADEALFEEWWLREMEPKFVRSPEKGAYKEFALAGWMEASRLKRLSASASGSMRCQTW